MGDLKTPLIKGARGIFKVTLTSLIAALACTGIIYAATTVGINITTTGTLTATGLTTMGNASSTLLSVSGTAYIGGSNGLIFTGGSITDASGAISFGNENLSTIGTLTIIGTSTLATTTSANLRNGEDVRVNGILRAVKYKDSAGNVTRVDIFFDSNVIDYCDGTVVGSIEWAEDQITTSGLIHIGAGDFPYSGTPSTTACTFTKNNLTIEGEGKATRMYPVVATDIEVGIDISGNYITLRNFFFDGGHDPANLGGNPIGVGNGDANEDGDCSDSGENCDGTDYLINAVEVAFTKIESMTVCCAGTDGIINAGSSDYTAVNNTIYDIYGNEGGDKSSALEIEDGAYRATYINNYITNATTCIFPHVHDAGTAPLGEALSDITFIGNTCIKGANGNNNIDVTILDNDVNGGGKTLSTMQFIGNKVDAGAILVSHDSEGNYLVDFTGNIITDSSGTGITCTHSGSTTEECNIVGGRITNSTDYGIRFTAGISGVVEAVRVSGTTNNHCISIESGTAGGDVTVIGNTVSGCGDKGISLSGGNGIINVVSNSINGSDILLGASGGAVDAYWNVSSNTLYNGNISVDSNSAWSIVNSNMIHGGGITVGGAGTGGHGTVSGNSIFEAPANGIYVQGAHSVTDNYIHSPATSGIYARYDSTLSDWRTISGNTIYNPNTSAGFGHGISIEGDEFLIDGNSIHDTTGNMDYGIYSVSGADSGVISNNKILGGINGIIVAGNNYKVHGNSVKTASTYDFVVSGGNAILHDNSWEGGSGSLANISSGVNAQLWNNYPLAIIRVTNGSTYNGGELLNIRAVSADIDFTLGDGVKQGQVVHIYTENITNCVTDCIVTVTHCDQDGDADGDCTINFDATSDKATLIWNEHSGGNANPAANSPEWELQPNYTAAVTG